MLHTTLCIVLGLLIGTALTRVYYKKYIDLLYEEAIFLAIKNNKENKDCAHNNVNVEVYDDIDGNTYKSVKCNNCNKYLDEYEIM